MPIDNIINVSVSGVKIGRPTYFVDKNLTEFFIQDEKARRLLFDALWLCASEKNLTLRETWRLHELYITAGMQDAAVKVEYTTGNINEVVTKQYGCRYRTRALCQEAIRAEIKMMLGEYDDSEEKHFWRSSLEQSWQELRERNLLTWKSRSHERPIVMLDMLKNCPEVYPEVIQYSESQIFLLAEGNQPLKPTKGFNCGMPYYDDAD